MHDLGLIPWGWDDGWRSTLRPADAAFTPGRVVSQERDRWTVQTAAAPVPARMATAEAPDPRPVVGDWVLLAPGPEDADPWSIRRVLPRRSAVERGAAGDGPTQVLAANVDHVWIVQGLDTEPNLRRIERTLAVAWQSGAVPTVILTKADLAADAAGARAEVAARTPGCEVDCVQADDAADMDRLRARIGPGRTAVLLGPSGAGKSTLLNRLAGATLAATGEVRATDHKGRHTTTRRALFPIEGGGLLIDTPGLRELRVGELDEGLVGAYPEIDRLAGTCRFRDCRHGTEPGCAVRAAVASGELGEDRLASFLKLQAEADWAATRLDPRARKAAIAEHKTALKTMKHHQKRKDPG